jgi:hypothetical protein
MRMRFAGLWFALAVAALVLLSASTRPQAESGKVPITTVVTATGKNFSPAPALGKQDITVREGKEVREVLNWIPAQGDHAGLQLAIVIDDSLRKSFGKELQSLSAFITSQPLSTSVGVFYAANGTLSIASQFNPDSAAVAKTLRMPLGTYGANSSIYQSLMQLIAGWPVTGARREVMLISDGFDYLRKERFSPDVQTTIDKAQTAGIIIYGIYEPTAGRPGVSRRIAIIGQRNLSMVTDGTGGYIFYQGEGAPVSIDPYLTQFGTILKNQYFLTYATLPSKSEKGEYRSLKVITERRDVEIKAQDKAFVPGSTK